MVGERHTSMSYRTQRAYRTPCVLLSVFLAVFLFSALAHAGPAGGAVSLDNTEYDFIKVADDPSLQFEVDGATPPSFTLEGWFYANTAAANQHLIAKRDYANGANTTNYALRFENGKLFLFYYTSEGLQAVMATSTSFESNAWNHVACTYDGTDKRVRMFVNGVEVPGYDDGGYTTTANPPYMSQHPEASRGGADPAPLAIGAAYQSNVADSTFAAFYGLIDEVRISKVVRYSSNFIPQTTPFVADSNTVLLLHCDQSVGLTNPDSVRDASIYGNHGELKDDAVIVNSDAPFPSFSGNALDVDGVNSEYLAIPDGSDELDFTAAQNFSISMWVKTTAWGTNIPLLDKRVSGAVGYDIWMAYGDPRFRVGGTTLSPGTPSFADGTWHYFLFVYKAGATDTMEVHVDGLYHYSRTATDPDPSSSDSLFVGTDGAGTYFTGLIDEVRIENGIITDTYVPSQPVRVTSNTKLLLRMDHTEDYDYANNVRDESNQGLVAYVRNGAGFAQSDLYRLNYYAGPANPDSSYEAGNATEVPMLQFRLSAAAAQENVSVSWIRPRFTGSGNDNTDFAAVELWQDVNENGSVESGTDVLLETRGGGPITADEGYIYLYPDPGLTLTPGDSVMLLITVDFLTDSATAGEEYQMYLPTADIRANGVSTDEIIEAMPGDTVTGGKKIISTTASTVSVIEGQDNPGSFNIGASADSVVMIQFVMNASSADTADIDTVALTVTGTMANVTKATIWEDENTNGYVDGLDSKLDSINNPTSVMNFFPDVSGDWALLPGQSKTWLVSLDFNTASGSYSVVLDSIDVTGHQTIASTAISGGSITGGTATISTTGTITITEGENSPASGDFGNYAKGVEMLQFKMAVDQVMDLQIDDLELGSFGTLDDASATSSVILAWDTDEDGEYTSADSVISAGTFNGETVTFTAVNRTIAAGHYEYWLVVYDLNGTASAGETFGTTIASNVSISFVAATPTVTGPPIIGNQMSIANSSALTITPGSNNPGDQSVDANADDIPVLQLTLTADAAGGVAVNTVAFTHVGTGDELTDLEEDQFKLYRDVNGDGQVDVGDELIGTSNYDAAACSLDQGSLTGDGATTNVLNGKGAATWEAWVYPEATAMNSRDIWWFKTQSRFAVEQGRLSYYLRTTTTAAAWTFLGTAQVTQDAWNHVAFTYDGTQVVGYINGTPTDTVALSGAIYNDASVLYMGAANTNGNAWYGYLDEVRVSDVVRYSGDFTPPDDPFLVDGNTLLLYHFDEGEGITTEDASETGADLTFVAGGWTEHTGSHPISTTPMTFDTRGQVISAGTSEDWLLIYNFGGDETASDGETFAAMLDSTIHVNAEDELTGGKIVAVVDGPGSADSILGGTMTVGNVGTMTLQEGASNPSNGPIAQAGESDVVFMQFALVTSSVESIRVGQVKLKYEGLNADTAYIDSFKLAYDIDNNGIFEGLVDTRVDTVSWYESDTLDFDLGVDSLVLQPSTLTNFLVVGYTSSGATEDNTWQVTLKPENVYGRGVSSATDLTTAGSQVSGPTYTVRASGQLTISLGTNTPDSSTIAADAENVVMTQVHLAASAAEDITITEVRVAHSGSGEPDTALVTNGAVIWRDVNNSGTLEPATDQQLGTGEFAEAGFASALEFDGSTDYVLGPSGIDLTGDITVEAWIYPTASPTYAYVIAKRDANNANPTCNYVLRLDGLRARFFFYSGGTLKSALEPATTMSTNQWHHVAGTFNSTTDEIAVYVDGTRRDLDAVAVGDPNTTSAAVAIGGLYNSSTTSASDVFPGNIDEVRISSSVRYSGATVAVPSDPFTSDASTEMLWHMDEGTGSSIDDASSNNRDGTASGTLWTDGQSTSGYSADISVSSATISAGTSEDWIIVYTFDGSASNGNRFVAVIDTATDITTSSSVDKVGGPVTGKARTVSAEGTLTMGVGSNNPGASSVSPGATSIPMVQFTLSASPTEDININQIKVVAIGTGDDVDDLAEETSVTLYEDKDASGTFSTGDAAIAQGVFTADNGTLTLNTSGQTIASGETETWLVTYAYADSIPNNKTFAARIIAGDITAVGATSQENITVGGTSPVTGGTKTTSSEGTLTIALGNDSPASQAIGPNETKMEMIQLSLSASYAESLWVKSLKLRADGTADELNDITAVWLYDDLNDNGAYDSGVDTSLASSATYSVDNDTVRFTFSDVTGMIPKNGTENWLVLYDLNGNASNSETFKIVFDVNSYVAAYDTSGAETRSVTGAPVTGPTMTVSNVGVLSLSLGEDNPGTSNEGATESDLVMMQLHLAASSAETLYVDSVVVTTEGTIDDATDVSAVRLYRDVNSNGALDLVTDVQIDSNRTFSADNGTATFYLAVSETLAAGDSEDWLVVYDMNGTASSGETFRAKIAANAAVKAVGISGGDHAATVSGAPLTGSYKTVTTSGVLTLSEGGSNPGASAIDSTDQDVAMVQFSIAASSVEDIKIRGIGIRHTGTADPATDIKDNNISIYRDVNGNGVLDGGTDVLVGYSPKFNGHALNFDADYVTSDGAETNFLYGESTATWEAWVRPTTSGTLEWLSKNLYRFRITGDRLSVAVRTTGTSYQFRYLGDVTVNLNEWNHVAVVLQNSQLKGYINGQYSGAVDALGTLYSNTDELRIGCDYNGGTWWRGDIDEVRISDVARYTGNFTPPTVDFQPDGNTLLLWHCDAGEGTTISDASDNNITGTFGTDTYVPTWTTGGGAHADDIANITITGQTISAGTSRNWLVVYDLGGEDTASLHETFTAHIDPTRIVAQGVTSSAFVEISGTTVSGGEKTVQTEGSLNVTAGVANPDPANVGPGTESLPMLQIQLSASRAESLLISSFKIKAYGSGDDSADVDSVALIHDLNENGVYDEYVDSLLAGGVDSFGTDDGTITFNFSSNYLLPSDASHTWLVAYDLHDSIPNNKTFQTRIELANYISVTGKTTTATITPTINIPLTGGTMTVSNIGVLSISAGDNNPQASNEGNDASDVPVLQLHLAASNAESLDVDSIAVTLTGTMNHGTDVSTVKLYRDVNSNGLFDAATDQAIATSQTVSDSGETVHFAINTADSLLLPNDTQDWLVLVSLAGTASNGETFGAKIVANDSLWVNGVESGGDGTVAGAPITSASKTITVVGSLTLAVGDNNPSSSTVDNNAYNLGMLQMRLTASSAEAVKVTQFRLRATGTAHDTTDINEGGIKVYNDVNGNGSYDSGTDVLIAQATQFSNNDGYIDFTSLDRTISAGQSENWLVVYDLAGTASNEETFVAYVQKEEIQAVGVTSSQSISATGETSVTGGTKTVSVEGTLTLSLGPSSPAAANIASSEENVVVMQLELQASSAESLFASQIKFKAEGTGNDLSQISNVELWDDLNSNGVYDTGIDSAIVSSGSYAADNGIVTFSLNGASIGYPFAPSSAHRWLVVYDMGGSLPNGLTFKTSVPLNSSVTVTDKNSEARTVYGAETAITSATKTVSSTGTLTLTAGSANPGASDEGANSQGLVMLQLHLAASYAETLVVDSVIFNASGTINDGTDISAVKLYRDVNSNGQLDLTIDAQIDSARAFSSDNGTVTFSKAVRETIAAGASEDWLVIYDMAGTAPSDSTFRVSINDNSQFFVLGTTLGVTDTANVTGSPLYGNYMTVTSSGSLTLSEGASNPVSGTIDSVAQNVAMLQFKLEASAVEDIEVLGVAVRHTGSADAVTDINSVEIYKDANGNGALDTGTDVYLGGADEYEGAAIYFDGGDLVEGNGAETNFLSGKSTATWEAWVYPTTPTGNRTIVAKDVWRLRLTNSEVQMYINTSSYAGWVLFSGTTLTTNEWSHVATVLSGGKLKAYVNGQEVSEADVPGTVDSDDDPLRIGTDFNGGDWFVGNIDEVRISDIARYSGNFTVPKADFQPDDNTMLLWHLDEGSGTTVGDASSNDITGTFGTSTNEPTWTTAGGDHAEGIANVSVGQRTITAGTSQNWLVIYDLGGSDTASVDETFTAWVDQSRISAIGATSGGVIGVDGSNVNGGEKTVSVTGALTVNEGTNNPTNTSVGSGTRNLSMLQIQLTASNAETLMISQFKIKASGTGDDLADIDSVALFQDLNNNAVFDTLVDESVTASKVEFSADNGTATFTIPDSLELPKGQTINLLFTYDLNDPITNGKTFTASIELLSYITVTGKKSDESITPSMSIPLSGGTMTVSNVGVLSMQAGDDNPGAANEGNSAENTPILQLELSTSNAETLRVDSIAVTMIGTMRHDSCISSMSLFEDVNSNGLYDAGTDQLVAATETISPTTYDSAFTVRFAINTADSLIPPSSVREWLVTATLNGTAPHGKTFGVKIVANDSVWAVGAESDQDAGVLGAPITSALKTISNVGSLTLSEAPNNPDAGNIATDGTNLPMLLARLTTSSAEGVEVEQFRLRASGTANDTADIADSGIKVYLDANSNGTYDAGTDQLLAQATAYNQDNGWVTFTGFNRVIAAGQTEDWLILYDLAGTASNNETFVVSMWKNEVVATGVTSDSTFTVSGNSVSGGTMTVSVEGTMTISAGPNTPGTSPIAPSETNAEMLQLKLAASSAETLFVTQVKFKAEGTGHDVNDLTNVEIWDDLDANGALDTGVDTALSATSAYSADNGVVTVNFSGDGYRFSPSAVKYWLVVHDYAGGLTNGKTYQVTVPLNSYLTVVNTDAASRTVTGAAVTGASRAIDNVGTLSIAAGAQNPAAGNEGKNAQNLVMLQLNLTASAAETLFVDSIAFTAAGTIHDVDDISAVKLYRDINTNGALDLAVDLQLDSARAFTGDNGTVSFYKAVQETIAAGESEKWLVVYDLANSASEGETFRVSLSDNAHINVTGIAGGDHSASVTGAPVHGNYQTVTSTGDLTLSAGASNPASSNVDSVAENVTMVQFKLEASSVENIDVLGIGVRHSGSADARTDIQAGSVKIYRDANNNGTLDVGTDVVLGNAPIFYGYALDFDGADWVTADGSATNFLDGKSAATMEAWVYPTSIVNRRTVISKNDIRLVLYGGQVEYQLRTSAGYNANYILGTSTVTANQWSHIALVYDGSEARAYINGVEVGSQTHTGTVYTDNTTLAIGARYDVAANYFVGKIDEVRISSTARYTSDFTPPKADSHDDSYTELLWHMDEGTGTTISDVSDNDVTGTLGTSTNDPAWTAGGGAHADNIANVNTQQRTISAGTSENWLVVYNLGGSDTASIGETFTSWVDMARIVAVGQTSDDYVDVTGDNVAGGQRTVAATGSMSMNTGSNNPESASIGVGTDNVPMLQVQLTASNAETLLISQFKVKAYGTGDDVAYVDSVGLAEDTDGDGGYTAMVDTFLTTSKGELTTDDGLVTFDFSPALVLPKGGTRNFLVTYDMASSIPNGKTFQSQVVLATYVTLTGKQSTESITPTAPFPLAGGTMTVSNIGVLTLSAGTNNPGATSEAADAANVAMLQLNLEASNAETLRVDSISFNMTGTLNHATYISAVKLYKDVNGNGDFDAVGDEQIATDQTVADSAGSVRFVINTADTLIPPGEDQDWLVLISLAGGAPNASTFGVKVLANDSAFVFGAESHQDATVLGTPITSATKTVSNIGSITLAAGAANPTAANVADSTQDLAMMQFKLTVSSTENVKINEFTLRASGTAHDTSDIAANGIRVYKDVTANGVYDDGSDVLIAEGEKYSANDGYITFSSLNYTITAGTAENWLVVYDLNGQASNGETFIANIQRGEIDAVGVTSGVTIEADGNSVSGGVMTVSEEGVLTIATGSNSPDASTVAPGETNVVLLQIQLSASSAETLRVTEVTLKAEGSGDDANDVTAVELWDDLDSDGALNDGIDTQLNGSGTYNADNGTVTFTLSGDGYTFAPGSVHRWIVVHDFDSETSNGKTFRTGIALNSYIDVYNTSSVARTVVGAPVTSETKTVNDIGVLTISLGSNNPAAGNAAKDAEGVVLLQLNLAASAAETLRVDSITFTASGTIDESVDVDAVRLYRDENNNGELDLATDEQISVDTVYTANDGTVQFRASMAETLAAGTNADWLLVYDLAGSATDAETFRASFAANTDLGVVGLAGVEHAASVSGAPINGYYMTVSSVGELAIEAGPANPGPSNISANDEDVAMVQVRLTATSVESITVKSISVEDIGTGDALNDLTTDGIEIYRDVNSNGTYDSGTDQFLGSAEKFNGSALEFDGTDDFIIADGSATNLTGEAEGTWEAWIYPTSTAGYRAVFGKVDYAVQVRDGRLFANIRTTGSDINNYLGTETVTNNAWNHIAVVFDNGTLSGYINGSRVDQRAQTGTLYNNVNAFYVGAYNGASNRFIGKIDEVRVTAKAEYSGATYDTPSAPFVKDASTNLLWHFDEATGDSVYDASNNSITGGLGNTVDTQPSWIATSTAPFCNNRAALVVGERTIPKGETEDWLIIYDYNGSAALNETFTARVLPATIIAVGASSDSSISVTGNTVSGGQKTVSGVGTLSWTEGANNPESAGIDVSDTNVVMMQLQLTASSAENIIISSLKVRGTGTGSELADIDSVLIFRDANSNGLRDVGTDVFIDSTSGFAADNGSITFSPSPAETLEAGTTENWLVVYYFNGVGTTGENYKTTINLTTDITATGQVTSQSITPTGSLPIEGGLRTISTVGTLTMGLGTNNPSATVEAFDADSVTMLQLKLSANSVENIGVDTLYISVNGSGDRSHVAAAKLYIDANNDGLVSDGETLLKSLANPFSTTDDTMFVLLAATAETINASTSENWLVVFDFASGTHNETYRVTLSTNDYIKGTGGLSGDLQVIGAPITGNYKTLSQTGSLTIVEGPNNPPNQNAFYDSDSIYVFQLALSASSVETVTVNTMTVTHGGTGDPYTDISRAVMYHDVDGDGVLEIGDDSIGVATFASTGDTARFSFTNVDIPMDSTVYWLMTYDFAGSASRAETFRPRLLNADDVVAEGKASTSAILPSKVTRRDEVGNSEMIELPPEVPVIVSLLPSVRATEETGQDTLSMPGAVAAAGRAARGAAFSTSNGAQITTYETGNLTVTAGTNNPASSTFTVLDDSIAVFQIKLAADNVETLTVTELRLVGTGTADRVSSIDSVRIYRDVNNDGILNAAGDGTRLGNGGFSAGVDTVTFSGLSITVPQNESINLLALIKTSDQGVSGKTFSTYFKDKTFITAQGLESGRTVGDAYKTLADSLTSNEHAFTTGVLTVTSSDITPTQIDTADQDVSMMKLTFTVSGPAVILDSLHVDNNWTGGPAGTFAVADMESLKVYKDTGNGTYLSSEDSLVGGEAFQTDATIDGGSATVGWATPDTLRSTGSYVAFVVYDYATGGVGDPSHSTGTELIDSSYVQLALGDVSSTNFPHRLLAEKSLPVELTSFTANVVAMKVKLQWVTASEVDNASWIIQRQVISTSDTTVAARAASGWEQVHSLPGAGNSSHQRTYRFIDMTAEVGVRYAYRLIDVNSKGVETYHEPVEVLVTRPLELSLGAAWPNPANPTTSWLFTLPEQQHVKITVYNIMGQRVRTLVNEVRAAGIHRVDWNARDAAGRSVGSGIYLYVMEVPNNSRFVRRLSIIR